MTPPVVIALVSLLLNLGLGILVLVANTQRLANRQFLVLTVTGSAWLGALVCSFCATTESGFLFWVRAASIVGCLVPIGFRLVRLAVLSGQDSMLDLLKRSKWQLGVFGFIAIYCLTDFYMKGVQFRPDGIPDTINGSLAFLFPLAFLGLTVHEIIRLFRGICQVRGLRRFELQFLLAGVGILIVLGVLPSMVIPLVAENSQAVIFAPLWIVMMDGVIAYGIATRRIMNVSAVMRRVVSMALLVVYLGVCYAGVFIGMGKLFGPESLSVAFSWPNLAATLAVVLTYGRVQNILKVFLDRAFASQDEINPIEGWRQAEALTKVTTTPQLLEQFSHILSKTAGTDRASVDQIRLGAERSVVEDELERHQQPLSASGLARRRSDDVSRAVIRELASGGWELALGIFEDDRLRGVVYVAERLSGRIYSEKDLRSLELLVTRFSKALENATLYTQVANRDIYNQTLLDNLVSGVLAADATGLVTMVNPEAVRLLGEDAIQAMPDTVSKLLAQILQNGEETHNVVLELPVPGEPDQWRAVRAGGAPLRDNDGEQTGALLVLHDISEERRLEKHVRHSDRLATIGKVSASVAHEIKNPLVAIKAFAQLLPERLQDEDFLSKFSKLLDGEVERINASIGGLLSYAGSGSEKVEYGVVSLHEAVRASTNLLSAEFRKKHVEVTHDLEAPNDLIDGHAGQLKQIVVNLLMNANDAVSNKGSITISSRLGGEGDMIELAISDDGEGITASEIRQVLIPFFTTKKGGTGLGLSLTTGLVSQHGGTMRFESEPDLGTTVHLSFPLQSVSPKEIPSAELVC